MKGLVAWYNANKKTIWTTIVIVIFILLLIRVLNSLSGQSLKKKQEMKPNSTQKRIAANSIILESEESAISGDGLSSEQMDMLDVIDKFGKYCTNGEVGKAYEMLSNECKEEMYQSEEYFKSAYYDQVFQGKKKDFAVENWTGNIYKVRFIEDALSTGTYNTGSAIQDYITVVKDDNGNAKINVNGYIRREKLNASGTAENVTIKAIETNVYMDYQTFTYEITNKSDKIIMLNEPNIVDTMYIADNKNIKYSPYTHELSQADFKIMPYETRKLTLKYFSKYVSTKKIKNISFGRIILDYKAYENPEDYYNYYGSIYFEL